MNKIKCKDGTEYEIFRSEKLGTGGFASVYKGRNMKTGDDVAIKEIRKRLDYGQKEVDQMAELSKDSNNIYTVPLLNHASSHGREGARYLYLVLPLYKEGALRSYIKANGKLSVPVAAKAFLQIVNGLEYLHKGKGIMHRDLSPGNILVQNEFNGKLNVLIGDLGFAKSYENGTNNRQTACGTPGYMPPDFKQGKYNMASEVYSLGGILYFMLTGKEPSVNMEDEQLKDIINAEAADLIKNLWHKEPSKRLSLDQIKNHPFLRRVPVSRSNTGSTRNKSNESRTRPPCSHRIPDKKTGKCACGAIVPLPNKSKPSNDSAYGSTEQRSTKNTIGKSRRTSSQHGSTQKSDHDDKNEVLAWPIPSLRSICPEEPRKQTIDTRILNAKRGRFMIVKRNVIVFEALDEKQKYIKYIFVIGVTGVDSQKLQICAPEDPRVKLPQLDDAPIETGKVFHTVYNQKELPLEFTHQYNQIFKAAEKFHRRNAIIDCGYVKGDRRYTAKLMCDRSFRFIFDGKPFVQVKDEEIKAENKKGELTKEEEKLFRETKKWMMELDRVTMKYRGGKWYKPLHISEKNNL